MPKRPLSVLAAGVALLALLGATATAAAAAPAVTSFAGTVALDDCSGSVVKTATAADTDPALVLTNGHCLETGLLDPGQVVLDQPSQRTFSLLSPDGRNDLGTLGAKKVVYATMTGTDVTLYQLTTTYAQVKSQYGISPLVLSSTHPAAGTTIDVVSGYWRTVYSCSIDGFVYELHEAGWVWKDSIRYTQACHTIGGTSGSPVVDRATGLVVGVNNTGNDDGGSCTLNNPCEVDRNGKVTVHYKTNYGEETYLLQACLTAGSEIDLNRSGCVLAKPAA